MPVLPAGELRFAELPGRRSADPLGGLTEDCSVRIAEIPPGPRTPHRHPHSIEVVYVAAGTGRVWEGETATDVGPGDMVLVPVGVPHATVCTSVTPLRLVCFFPHSDLAGNLDELPGPVRS